MATECSAGVAGLRARAGRRHVRLFLIDHPQTTSVVLADASRQEWATALPAIATKIATDYEIDNWILPPTGTFLPGEQATIAEARPWTITTAPLGSGRLRRIGSLRDADWIDLWWNLCHGINLDWPAHPITPPSHS